jgi:ABC-type proline/glycine betaine transport system permease subunit
MWSQYKRTFAAMQSVIWLFVAVIGLWSQRISTAAVFLVVMQVSAVIGALWSLRIKRKFTARHEVSIAELP